MIEEGYVIEEALSEESAKISSLIQTVNRKGLVSDAGQLTLEGKVLLAFLSTEEGIKLVRNKPVEDHFIEWWKSYRSNDIILLKEKTGNINDKSVLFSGSRGLKVNKEDCRIKFNKILSEGEYTAEDLIRALKYEIDLKIQKSIKEGQNKLSYMQNSLTYLNQRTFENFVEISKNNQISYVKSPNATDI